MSITTKIVCLNTAYGEMYSIQQYGIKIVGDRRQVGDFLRVLQFHPPKKFEILLKVALNTINPIIPLAISMVGMVLSCIVVETGTKSLCNRLLRLVGL